MDKKIVVIPADPRYDTKITVHQKKLRVAAYCRVSTRLEEQEQSFDAQVEYYTKQIIGNPNWEFVGIYADLGKTGTGTKKRSEFTALIDDCFKGKIDMVITKSISRFGRNTLEFLQTIRALKDKEIRVFFEKENIDTMNSTGELLITILSSQAQEESRNLSENTRWGIVRKFEQGVVFINHTHFMGYTKNEKRELVIEPEGAKIVRKIFSLYLKGYSLLKIAEYLDSKNVKTATGKGKWQTGTLSRMLRCEKYVGDALLQKTFTVDFLTHKKVVNKGHVKQYYIKNNHEAIISRKDFNAVAKMLKSKNKKIRHKQQTEACLK